MRRALLPTLLTVCSILAAPALPQAAAAEKIKIAVLDFQVEGLAEDDGLGRIVAGWLTTALVGQGRFEVVERRLLKQILDEHKLTMTGVIDEASASRIGRMLGAGTIVAGSVVRVGTAVEVNARMIDVEQGSIIAAERVEGSDRAELHEPIAELALRLARSFPLDGYVVKRAQDSIKIDLGQRAGVRKGMKFVILEEGEAIKHPKTGEVLEREATEVGLVEVVAMTAKLSEATILRESAPGAIEYGHRVRSVRQADLAVDLLGGRFEAYDHKPSTSSAARDADGTLVWTYRVPKVKDDTYAGLNLLVEPVSMKDRIVTLTLESDKGAPIYIWFRAFIPGYSRMDDEDTWAPAEAYVRLKPGRQEIVLHPTKLGVPSWWREENSTTVGFSPEDIRMIELGADVDEDLGPVSDTVRIRKLVLR